MIEFHIIKYGIRAMNTLIIACTVFLAIIGCGVAIWSIYDTRNRYYEEYLDRKRRKND